MLKSLLTLALVICGTAISCMLHLQTVVLAASPDVDLKQAIESHAEQFFSSPAQAVGIVLAVMRSPDFFPDGKTADDYARRLGFDSAAEVAGAELGSPFEVRRVGLKALSAFTPQSPLSQLWEDAHTLIYPITVNGHVRSSISVSEFGKEGWHWTRRGEPALMRLMEASKKSVASDKVFAVAIPGLSLWFIGAEADGDLELVPIALTQLDHFQLSPGQKLSGRDVFVNLAPVASKVLSEKGRYR